MILRSPWLIPLAGGFAFLGLALFVISGRDLTIDRALLLMLRQPGDPSMPLGPLWLQEAMRDLTALGSFVGLGLMTVVAAIALWICGFHYLSVGLMVSVVGATVVSTALKIVFDRDRPDFVAHAAKTFTQSFPSGHAFLSAVTLLCIAGFVGLASRRSDLARAALWIAWAMVVLIGISRIYLGVHWPTDVLAGWCIGLAWSGFVVATLGRMMERAEMRAKAEQAAAGAEAKAP